MPDGSLWILGGAGHSNVLDTTEFVFYDIEEQKWKIEIGPELPYPMMGHCAVLINDDETLVFGGIVVKNENLTEYSSLSFIYNFR